MSIDSALFKKTIMWNLKRNEDREIIFPLEDPKIVMEAPVSKICGRLFSKKLKQKKGHNSLIHGSCLVLAGVRSLVVGHCGD